MAWRWTGGQRRSDQGILAGIWKEYLCSRVAHVSDAVRISLDSRRGCLLVLRVSKFETLQAKLGVYHLAAFHRVESFQVSTASMCRLPAVTNKGQAPGLPTMPERCQPLIIVCPNRIYPRNNQVESRSRFHQVPPASAEKLPSGPSCGRPATCKMSVCQLHYCSRF